MKPPVTTRKLTTLSLLAAIALALYAVESALPPIVPIPGIKLGLANIITLVVLWKYSAKDAFFVLLVRILLATCSSVRPSVSCTVSPAVSCAYWQWYLCNGCCMGIICSSQV